MILAYEVYRNFRIFCNYIFFHAYKSFSFFFIENSAGHYLFFERSGARNFKYFYTIAEIGRFESSGETILYWDVLTRLSRKFRGLHCVRIYRLTCTTIRATWDLARLTRQLIAINRKRAKFNGK